MGAQSVRPLRGISTAAPVMGYTEASAPTRAGVMTMALDGRQPALRMTWEEDTLVLSLAPLQGRGGLPAVHVCAMKRTIK